VTAFYFFSKFFKKCRIYLLYLKIIPHQAVPLTVKKLKIKSL
jgi:hypothetical protein